MNTLIVCDVFDAYYDGRKSAFVSPAAKGSEGPDVKRAAKRDEAANSDTAGKAPRAA